MKKIFSLVHLDLTAWQLKELDTRYQLQEKNYEDMPGSNRGRYLSNKTHYSPAIPIAA